MQISANGMKFIEQFEACKLVSYQDSDGTWTVGYGNTQPISGVPIGPGCVITEAQATELLQEDLAWAERAVTHLVTVPLTQNQADATISLVFNIGYGNFRESTFLKDMNESAFAAAADQFLVWDHSGGQVIEGLLRRRTAERALFLTT